MIVLLKILIVCGRVLPVGGIPEKIQAAAQMKLKRVIIPTANRHERYGSLDIQVIPISTLCEAIDLFTKPTEVSNTVPLTVPSASLPAASGPESPEPVLTQPSVVQTRLPTEV